VLADSSTISNLNKMENKINFLAQIQSEVKAPKGQFNSFGKYKYRSAEDILEAVKPIVNSKGFSITLSDEIIAMDGRFYIKATATLTNGKETYSATGFAREEESKKGMDGSQVTGASSSYSRKYALNGLFALDDTKDSDATNTHGQESKRVQAFVPKPAEPQATINSQELGELKRLLDECSAIEHLTELWEDIEDKFKSIPAVKTLFSQRKQQIS
jgi:hypothetical protein